jgi:hypothetical protein
MLGGAECQTGRRHVQQINRDHCHDGHRYFLDETNGPDHIPRGVAEDDVVEARGVSVEAFASDSSEIATDVLAVSIEPCA